MNPYLIKGIVSLALDYFSSNKTGIYCALTRCEISQRKDLKAFRSVLNQTSTLPKSTRIFDKTIYLCKRLRMASPIIMMNNADSYTD